MTAPASTEPRVRDLPILFTGAMVRGILNTRPDVWPAEPIDPTLPFKWHTRRIVQPQPDWVAEVQRTIISGPFAWPIGTYGQQCGAPLPLRYAVGDRLWVKETWQYADWTGEGSPYIGYRDGWLQCCDDVPEEWADRLTNIWADLSAPENIAIDGRAADRRWRSARFMPRWASRLTLEITDVRVERVQDISARDILAEGAVLRAHDDHFGHNPVSAFDGSVYLDLQSLWVRGWDSINARRSGGAYSWQSNPWVWAVSFRRLS